MASALKRQDDAAQEQLDGVKKDVDKALDGPSRDHD